MAIETPFNPVKLPVMGAPTPFTNIVPFTERDGTNYLRTLTQLIHFINSLIDAINQSDEKLYAAVREELQKTRDDVQAALDAQDQRNADRDQELREDVENAIQQIINLSIELSDEVMHAVLVNSTTDFRKELTRILAELVDGVNARTDQEIETLTEYVDLADTALRNSVTTVTEKISATPTGYVSIEHKRTITHTRDVYTIRGNRAAIRKLVPDAIASDGSVALSDQMTPTQMSKQKGILTLTNCDAATGGSRSVNNGINIAEGVAYQDFGKGSGGLIGADLEALLLMKDGSMRAARRSDGKTAQQYVDEGAWSSFGYGPILVANGVRQNWHTDPRFSGFVGEVSARLIFGMTAKGDYKIILVEGKTGSYGIDGEAITNVALDEGLTWAVNLDGGGTVQGMFDGNIVHPSSDGSGERRSITFIGITVPPANKFDTGWIELPPVSGIVSAGSGALPVAIRQHQNEVMLKMAAILNPAHPVGSWKILSNTPIMPRFRPRDNFAFRGTLAGGSGRMTAVSVDEDWHVNATNVPGATNDVSGVYGVLSTRLDR